MCDGPPESDFNSVKRSKQHGAPGKVQEKVRKQLGVRLGVPGMLTSWPKSFFSDAEVADYLIPEGAEGHVDFKSNLGVQALLVAEDDSLEESYAVESGKPV